MKKTTRDRIASANTRCGVDTLEVRIDSEPPHLEEIDYVTGRRISKDIEEQKFFMRINPNKANGGIQIYNYSTYRRILDNIIFQLGLINPVKTRIDFCFDSYDTGTFEELLKVNKLIILLLSETSKAKNVFQSYNPRTLKELTVRMQTDRLEVENYNKAIQEPEGNVKSRLELRSKKLYDTKTPEDDKEEVELNKWFDRLDKAITKENFDKLQAEMNKVLVEKYKEESKDSYEKLSLKSFIFQYRHSIFTSKQLQELYGLLGSKNPKEAASKLKSKIKIEYFSFSDLLFCKRYLKNRAEEFLKS